MSLRLAVRTIARDPNATALRNRGAGLSILAANPCSQRQPKNYIADALSEIEGIKNPNIGDVAFLINESVLEAWRLFSDENAEPDGFNVIQSNTCSRVWKRAQQNQTDIDTLGGSVSSLDNSAALNDAIESVWLSGGGIVTFGAGRYRFLSQIRMRHGVYLVGKGSGATILDFTDSTATVAHIIGEGELDALPSLASNITAGSSTWVLASPPDVAPGDVILVHDETDGSYNSVRPYYHAGEHARVFSVSGSTITLAGSSMYDYSTGADRKLYRLSGITCGFKGMRMEFAGATAPAVAAAGIKISFGLECVFEDLYLTGSNYTQIFIDRCAITDLNRVRGHDFQPTIGNNYIILLGNSWRTTARGLDLETTRHGWAAGGSSGVPGIIPNRWIAISNSTINGGAGQSAPGLDFHGNCEFVSVVNCSMQQGMSWGGDYFVIAGNSFSNGFINGTCIVSGEPKGNTCLISGNTFIASHTFANGLLGHNVIASTDRPGGIYTVTGNTFDFRGFGNPLGEEHEADGVKISNNNPGTEDVSISVTGNSFTTNSVATGERRPLYGIHITPSALWSFRSVTISDNTLNNCGIRVDPNIERGYIEGNEINNANDFGIVLAQIEIVGTGLTSFIGQQWSISDNVVVGARGCGIICVLHANDVIHCNGNYSVNNAAGGNSGSTSTDSSLFITCMSSAPYPSPTVKAYILDNYFGDERATGSTTQRRIYALDKLAWVQARNYNVGRLVNALVCDYTTVTEGSIDESEGINYRTITTTPFTTLHTDRTIMADTTGTVITVNLPSAALCQGKIFYVKKIDASANALTVAPAGSDLIEGAGSVNTSTQWVGWRLMSVGTGWLLQ